MVAAVVRARVREMITTMFDGAEQARLLRRLARAKVRRGFWVYSEDRQAVIQEVSL